MGFFNCCSLVGHSAFGAVFLGTAGVSGVSVSGFFGGATGGGSGAFVSYSILFGS